MTRENLNNQNFKNGCIYYFSERIFTLLNHLNLVEGFKYISQIVTKGNSPKKKILFSRLAVDVFIILKWLLVIILWIFNVEDLWVIFIVWYLLIANLYTYFYYHTWSSNILTDANIDVNRIKRRYLNLTMAIAYTFSDLLIYIAFHIHRNFLGLMVLLIFFMQSGIAFQIR